MKSIYIGVGPYAVELRYQEPTNDSKIYRKTYIKAPCQISPPFQGKKVNKTPFPLYQAPAYHP